jgi:hypothetical protein
VRISIFLKKFNTLENYSGGPKKNYLVGIVSCGGTKLNAKHSYLILYSELYDVLAFLHITKCITKIMCIHREPVAKPGLLIKGVEQYD